MRSTSKDDVITTPSLKHVCLVFGSFASSLIVLAMVTSAAVVEVEESSMQLKKVSVS